MLKRFFLLSIISFSSSFYSYAQECNKLESLLNNENVIQSIKKFFLWEEGDVFNFDFKEIDDLELLIRSQKVDTLKFGYQKKNRNHFKKRDSIFYFSESSSSLKCFKANYNDSVSIYLFKRFIGEKMDFKKSMIFSNDIIFIVKYGEKCELKYFDKIEIL